MSSPSHKYSTVSTNNPEDSATLDVAARRKYNTFNSSFPPMGSGNQNNNGSNEPAQQYIEIYDTRHKFPIQIASRVEHEPNAQKKCSKCKKLYLESDNNDTSCKYHRGRFTDRALSSSASGIKQKTWTCCKGEFEYTEGCTLGNHLEDHATTAILNTFKFGDVPPAEPKPPKKPVQQNYIVEDLITLPEDDDKPPMSPSSSPTPMSPNQSTETTTTTTSESTPPTKRKAVLTPFGKAFHHTVEKTDTLQGVALRYNVKVEDLKKMNKLSNSSIFSYKQLLVPLNKM